MLRCEAAKRGVVTSPLASFLRLVDVIRMIRCLYYENVSKKNERKKIYDGISLIKRKGRLQREKKKQLLKESLNELVKKYSKLVTGKCIIKNNA